MKAWEVLGQSVRAPGRYAGTQPASMGWLEGTIPMVSVVLHSVCFLDSHAGLCSQTWGMLGMFSKKLRGAGM